MTTFWESYEPLILRWIPSLSHFWNYCRSPGSEAAVWLSQWEPRWSLRSPPSIQRWGSSPWNPDGSSSCPSRRPSSFTCLVLFFPFFLFQVTGPRWWMMALDRGLAELWRSSSALQGCLCLTDPRFRHRCPPKSPKYREGITVVVVVVLPLLLLHPREDQGPPKRHNGHSESRYQAYSGAELQQLVKVKKWSKEPTVYSLPSI